MFVRIVTTSVLGAMLFTSSSSASADFAQSFVNLPAATEAVEAVHDLDGDGRNDLIVVFQRRILIFFQRPDATFASAPDLEMGSGSPIPNTYGAVSVGKIGAEKGLSLLLMGRGGVDSLSMAALKSDSNAPMEPAPLLTKKFDLPQSSILRYLGAAQDMDGDGLTDLVLPNSDTLEVYRQQTDGSLAAAGRLNLPMRTFQSTNLSQEPDLLGSFAFSNTSNLDTVFTQPQLNRWSALGYGITNVSGAFLMLDFNRDKRMDVLTGNQLFLQGADGKFNAQRSEAMDRIASAYSFHGRRLAAAPNLVDFDNDGKLDSFTVATSTAKLSPRTDVAVYLGGADQQLPEQPTFVHRTRDISYNEMLPIGDVDSDGFLDIALIHLDFQAASASSQLKAYMRNGLEGSVYIYFWDPRRRKLGENYGAKHPVLMNYDIYGTRQFYQQQIVMDQDIDGDGAPDLVMKTGAQEISVFRNLGGRRGYSTRATQKIATPTRFSSLKVMDLNADKKGDILVSGYIEDQDDRLIHAFFVSR